MKCKDAERWIVAGNGGADDDDAREAALAHLSTCPRCAALVKDLDALRGILAGRALSGPPAALVEKTRRLCLDRIEAGTTASPRDAAAPRPAGSANGALRRIPRGVWAATIGLVVLTGFIFAPFFGEALRSEPLSYASWVGLGFIVQNVFMLFFSPLLLRRKRRAEACA